MNQSVQNISNAIGGTALNLCSTSQISKYIYGIGPEIDKFNY